MTDPEALAKSRTFPEHYAVLARQDDSDLIALLQACQAAVLKLLDRHVHVPRKLRKPKRQKAEAADHG